MAAFLLVGLSTPAASQKYELLTPTEMLFSNWGRAAGNAASGAIGMYAEQAALNHQIDRARAAFHQCFPRCSKDVRQKLALALFARDEALLHRQWMRNAVRGMERFWDSLSVVGLGGPAGGVNEACRPAFDAWAARFAREVGPVSLNPLQAMAKMTSFKTAASRSMPAYVPYQRCRDAEEIALAEALR